jgi:hypothetical protein
MPISKPARICAASYGLIPELGKIAHACFWRLAAGCPLLRYLVVRARLGERPLTTQPSRSPGGRGTAIFDPLAAIRFR